MANNNPNNNSKPKKKDRVSEAIILAGIIIAIALLMSNSMFKVTGTYIIGSSPNATVNINITSEPKAWNTECSFNTIPGTDCLVLSANNPDVDNSGSKEDVWEGGGLMTYLTTAQTYIVVSTSTDDTVTGIGARTALVACLNEDFVQTLEVINLNGTTPVETTIECIRPIVLVILTGGSSEFNEGFITATSSVTGDLQIAMGVEESISKNSQFTVPANQTMIIKQITLGATKIGGQTPIVNIKGKRRVIGTSIWTETFNERIDTSVSDRITLMQPIGNEFNEKTDFRLEVTTTADNTDVTARIYMVFRDNE